jgi:hypothetical protein
MKKKRMLVCSALVLLGMLGCRSSGQGQGEEVSTDQLYKENRVDEVIQVFVYKGETYTTDEYCYEVDVPSNEPLEEAHFYRLVADVTLLNGGVAGYVNYPEIRSVSECTEVSPFELGFPSIMEQKYGLCLIGDYAEGDILLNDIWRMAVWKDGEWIYHYDRSMKLADGRQICYQDGVSEAEIQEGIQNGVLSCVEYFALPQETDR